MKPPSRSYREGDHPGSLSVDGVALAKCAAEQFLLRAGAPGEGRDNPGQHDHERRPAAEGERLAHGEQCEAQVDGVADEAIGARRDEARALICLGHKAPRWTKLGPGSEDEGRARQDVLRGISLDIAPGELVALVGQSGSGKSTLLNIIGGLDRADEGTVIVDGRDTVRLDDASLSRLRNERIGFIFQSFHLLDHLTCIENVSLPALFSPRHIDGTHARVGMKTALDGVAMEEVG